MKHYVTHENSLINRVRFPRPIDKTIWVIANQDTKKKYHHPYKKI